MRIVSGVTDQYIYFVAVDSTDLKTRETGLSSFTVYRSRNGGTATAYTTPTVAELSSSNMPGVYSLLLDEDMTIDSGDVEQEVCLHITQASMAPVTRVFTLFRPDVTAGQTLTVTSGRANADVTHIATAAVSTSTAQLGVNVVNFGGSAGTFASGRPEVNASHISGSATAADNAEVVFATDFATNYDTTLDRWQVDVDMISTDATAADNLEAMFDGAGYAGGTIKLGVDVVAISGDSAAADNLEAAADGTGYNLGGGSVVAASVTGAVGSVTGNVGGNVTGSVGSLAAQAKADVNAEVVDTLNTDTYAEPGQGTPGATITLAAKIGYLYKAWRNKSTQTSSEYALYADDTTTKDQEAVVSDDGTTFTRGEISTGA